MPKLKRISTNGSTSRSPDQPDSEETSPLIDHGTSSLYKSHEHIPFAQGTRWKVIVGLLVTVLAIISLSALFREQKQVFFILINNFFNVKETLTNKQGPLHHS